MRKILFFIAMILFPLSAVKLNAQGMAINATGAAPDASSMLDVSSATKGMLIPRMTNAQRNAISTPAIGLMIYQTDSPAGLYCYSGSAWTVPNGTYVPPGNNIGDMLYWNGTSWAAIPAGPNGVVLTMIASVPTWTTAYDTLRVIPSVNGVITPTVTTVLNLGNALTYTITPATNYYLNTLVVDGATVTPTATYTFKSINQNHTVTATFLPTPVNGTATGGGIIAYVLQPGDLGYNVAVPHGIISSLSDQGTALAWGCYGTATGATATAIGTGAANTATILSVCTTPGIPAQLCTAYTGGGYTDWYMPSYYELNKLYGMKTTIGGFSGTYWASSEGAYLLDGAWELNFNNGAGGASIYDKSNLYNVRAVRSF